jgi:hypothetical protein
MATQATEPNKTEPNKTEPDKTEPNKTKPNKTKPNKTTGPTATDYDAIIVGGGHNGLVAAAYLGRTSARTLVLEARHNRRGHHRAVRSRRRPG